MEPSRKETYLAAKRHLFDIVYGTRLNKPQCQAVFTTQGPLLVLAGAGSGKTTVLVKRISFMIRYGNAYFDDTVPPDMTTDDAEALETAAREMAPADIEERVLPSFICRPCPPWSILAITFTNKAANEIKERLATELGDESISSEITAGTFHSVCVRFLRQWGEKVGYRPAFTIYDTDDKKRLVVDIMKELNISDKVLPVKTVCNVISQAKDHLISPEKFAQSPDYAVRTNPRNRDILRVYEAYQKRMLEYNAMDFDDIIMKTVELLENHPDALDYYTRKYRYVCVDEYQDTNPAQFRLTELLASGSRNIMVVGDDDQSIYRFRGATVENILSFDKVYEDCKVIKLEQNYRSTKHILAAANAVIAHNQERHPKKLWCDAPEGDLIHLHRASDQNEEARYIIEVITNLKIDNHRRYRDFAVLYRLNEMARALESAFAKSGIPYRILGGQRFYDRKEIRDMVAYLYIIMNPSDDQRLKRIINEPKRGIGDATIDAVEQIARSENTSMFNVMARANQYVALSRAAAKLIEFTGMISALSREEKSPSAMISAVFERTGYREMLERGGEVEKPRIDAVEEFVSAAKEYEGRAEEPNLAGFMEEVALVSDVDKYDADADAVVLMTIHSAKGLEFPVVFLPGMEENVFPSAQANESPSEMNEERRLAYVAITRAKEALYISYTAERMLYGRTSCNALSRFVQREMPEELLQKDTYIRSFAPPKAGGWRNGNGYAPRAASPQNAAKTSRVYNASSELNRKVEPVKPRTASSFGLERYPAGTRVEHPTFGQGTVLEVRDMGGDYLYRVRFDTVGEKKLMATFAHLKKL